jgi:hypothetical protein
MVIFAIAGRMRARNEKIYTDIAAAGDSRDVAGPL